MPCAASYWDANPLPPPTVPTQALINFINDHAGCKVESVLDQGARLLVSSVVIDRSGVASRETDNIAATMKAARDWLGY